MGVLSGQNAELFIVKPYQYSEQWAMRG